MKETNEEENLRGCMAVGTMMILLMVCCLVLAFCSCSPKERIVEVEKWQHDTTTVVDTIHIKDLVVVHDSIYNIEYVTQYVKDSTQTDVAWKHYTYDKEGNVTSMTDYTSSTHQGSTAHTATESASTSVSDNVSSHEETGSHSESSGHSEAMQAKEQTKTGLSKWQKFIQVLGYAMLVTLALGAMFGGMRLYGKWKGL